MKFRDFLAGIPYLAWAVVYTALCWGLFSAILGAVSPELKRELADYQQLGTLMFAWATGNLVGAIQGGRLAQRHAPRPLFLAYIGLAGVALGVIVTASSFVVLMAGFFAIALFETAMFTLGHGILARVYDEPGARARVISLIDVAYSSGNLLTPMIVIGLQSFGDDWRLPYQAFALPLLAAWIVFFPRRAFAAARSSEIAHDTAATIANDGGYLALLRRPRVAWALAAGVLSAYVEWGQNFWYVNYAIHVQAMDANTARVGLQAFVAGMVVIRCWQAFVHSGWSLRARITRLNALALAGIALAVIWPGHGWFALHAFASFLLGLGIGVVFPILLALMIDDEPAQASRLSALLMVSFTLGTQLAGWLIGTIADAFGLHAGYATLLVAALGFTVAAYRLGRLAPSGV